MAIKAIIDEEAQTAPMLRVLAWTVLVLGLAGAVFLYMLIGHTRGEYVSELNPVGVAWSIMAALQGVVAFVVLGAIESVVSDARSMRNSLARMENAATK